jgi:hypothetical protein
MKITEIDVDMKQVVTSCLQILDTNAFYIRKKQAWWHGWTNA